MVRRKQATRTSRRKAVIFDFDGTIADSFEYVLGYLKLEAKNTQSYSAAEKKQLRQMSMKRLAMHLGILPWRLPFIYFKGRRVMRAHMEHVQPFPGMVDVLKQLNSQGWELYVVSSNSGKNIRKLLERCEVLGEIRAVRGGAGIAGKAAFISQLMRRFRLRKAATWYVGDEAADVVAAARAGIRCLAVGWGFADPAKLREIGPDAFAAHPEDIVKVLS